jgi:hypothetical protein
MNLAMVRFDDSNDDRIPAPRRAEYQHVLRQAIEACRPPGEAWTAVTHEGQNATILTFDFSRGTEVPRSLTFLPEGDDAQHSVLFKTACQFLRVYWKGAIAPSQGAAALIPRTAAPRLSRN